MGRRWNFFDKALWKLRACKTTEDETNFFRNEIALIRSDFSQPNLSGKVRRSDVWLLVVMMLSGRKVTFGHIEVLNLMASHRYKEKLSGYLSASLLFTDTDEMFPLMVNTILHDLKSEKKHNVVLALTAVANFCSSYFADSLIGDILLCLEKYSNSSMVQQRVCMTLLSLYRSCPEKVGMKWLDNVMPLLDVTQNIVCTVSVSGLLRNVVCDIQETTLLESIRHASIHALGTLLLEKDACPKTHKIFALPCPWLVVNCLQILRYCPYPSFSQERDLLVDSLHQLLNQAFLSKDKKNEFSMPIEDEHNYLVSAEIFACIQFIVAHYAEVDFNLRENLVSVLMRSLSLEKNSVSYCALDCLSRLALMPAAYLHVKMEYAIIKKFVDDLNEDISKRAQSVLDALQECDKQMLSYGMDGL